MILFKSKISFVMVMGEVKVLLSNTVMSVLDLAKCSFTLFNWVEHLGIILVASLKNLYTIFS